MQAIVELEIKVQRVQNLASTKLNERVVTEPSLELSKLQIIDHEKFNVATAAKVD
jgi:hypothetical protein